MSRKFSYKGMMDGLARSNFVWMNYSSESSINTDIASIEIKLNIPN